MAAVNTQVFFAFFRLGEICFNDDILYAVLGVFAGENPDSGFREGQRGFCLKSRANPV